MMRTKSVARQHFSHGGEVEARIAHIGDLLE